MVDDSVYRSDSRRAASFLQKRDGRHEGKACGAECSDRRKDVCHLLAQPGMSTSTHGIFQAVKGAHIWFEVSVALGEVDVLQSSANSTTFSSAPLGRSALTHVTKGCLWCGLGDDLFAMSSNIVVIDSTNYHRRSCPSRSN